MNFLAHLVLAPQTPRGLIGSIAPDLIRGPLPDNLHPEVLASAREHQRIDRHTDAHPAFVRTRDRLRGVVDPRLAGVLADVLYDHVLARDWVDWRSDTLAGFIAQTEEALLGQCGFVPAGMQVIVRRMVDERWLASYASSEGIRARLATMSARLTRRMDRPIDLTVGADELAGLYAPIADDFSELWPDLNRFVQQHRDAAEHRLAS